MLNLPNRIVTKIFNLFKTDIISVDFGTANCIILSKEKGLVLNEPTIVAINPKLNKVIAVGVEAKEIVGKLPEGIESRRPLQNGGISNFTLAKVLLKSFFNKSFNNLKFSIFKSTVIVSVPLGVTSVEKRALIKVFESIGFKKIYIFPEPIAAALGADMPIDKPFGNLIINLGGGTAEIAIISMNGIISYRSVKGVGDKIDENITEYIKKKYSILVSNLLSEKIKISIGNVLIPNDQDNFIDIVGKSFHNGLPKNLRIYSSEILEPIRSVLDNILLHVKEVIAESSAEIISDLMNRGGIMTGGSSLLKNIDKFFSQSLGIPISVADDPMKCVARGMLKFIDNQSFFTKKYSNQIYQILK